MLRALTWLIFGTGTVPSRFSTTMQPIPNRPNSAARARPTGPAPTTRTGVSVRSSMLRAGRRAILFPRIVLSVKKTDSQSSLNDLPFANQMLIVCGLDLFDKSVSFTFYLSSKIVRVLSVLKPFHCFLF